MHSKDTAFLSPGRIIFSFLIITLIVITGAYLFYNNIKSETWYIIILTLFVVSLSALILYFFWKAEKAKLDAENYNVLLEKQKMRQRLDIIIQNANDIFILLDENRNITDVNEKAVRTYGYSREEFLKLKADDLRAPAYKNSLPEVFKELLEKNRTLIETYHIRKNGEVFPVEIGNSIIKIDSNKIIQSIIRDITDRKQAEETIHQSQERYKELFESNPNPMWVYNVNTLKFVDVNKMAEFHYGYTKKEFLTMTLKDIRPAEDIKALEQNIKTSGDEVQDSGVWRHKKKNGEIIFVEIKSNSLSLPGYENCRLVLINDVTERIKAKEAVRYAEERFRNALDNMMEGCQIIDFNMKYVYLNDVAAGQGQYGKEKFLGRRMMEMYPGIENTEMFGNLKRCMKERTSLAMENEFQYPNGNKSWFKLRMEPVPEGVFILSEDITNDKKNQEELKLYRKNLEQMVKVRTEQLEVANKELESFSYSVSHDLRAPLRAIDGFSKMLIETYGNKFDETGNRWLDIVRKNTQQMGQLIDDLLQFSRTGRKDVSPVDIDMRSLFYSIYNELTDNISGRKINFVLKEMPIIKADQALIKQVIVNLLSNAIKFTKNKEEAEIEAGSYKDNNDIVFYVKDNGAGFDMGYKDKLFGVFHRLHRMEDFEGTGVGLALVNRIIKKHNGKVWADAKVNEGATFYFSLSGGTNGL